MNSTATFVCIHKLPVHTYVTFQFKNTPVCEKNNHYKQQSMKDNYFNNGFQSRLKYSLHNVLFLF